MQRSHKQGSAPTPMPLMAVGIGIEAVPVWPGAGMPDAVPVMPDAPGITALLAGVLAGMPCKQATAARKQP